MVELRVLTLGAGQDVGRSCVVVHIGGKTVMFDCGMHMGYHDERKFPDFKLISRSGNYTQAIDAVIVTHFHLDHCGALPYFTEVCGYDGPIYMTYPTKAIVPVMLEDFHKVMTDRRGEAEQFSRKGISDCMRKVTPVDLNQTVLVGDGDMEIRAYYAGHVLGAAMFYLRVGDESVVYTGDYNMTPDRHLGAARIDRLRPDLLITETTYATTIRDSKRARERDFLTQVHETVSKGGKVLIPVFALGRAQELCILLDEYWERMNLEVPIYLSHGMTSKANMYYKLLVNWTSEKIKRSHAERNTFGFARMRQWERSMTDRPGPCVLLATPGMLVGGTSLEVFKAWASSELNMVILPGYCTAGTVGSKLMSGNGKAVDVSKHTKLNVACKVRYLSFSAHADAKGIMALIQQCAPRHVMLVHGEPSKMEFLSNKISKTFKVRVFMPPNGSAITMRTSGAVPVSVSRRLVTEALRGHHKGQREARGDHMATVAARAGPSPPNTIPPVAPVNTLTVGGVLLCAEGEDGKAETALLANDEVAPALRMKRLKISFGTTVTVLPQDLSTSETKPAAARDPKPLKKRRLQATELPAAGTSAAAADSGDSGALQAAAMFLHNHLAWGTPLVEAERSCISLQSFRAILSRQGDAGAGGSWQFACSWLIEDDQLATDCIQAFEAMKTQPREIS